MTSGEDDVRRGLREVVAATHEYPADRFAGRGVVVCAGGARLVTNAWVTIAMLRRTLGCTLPIEVWHLGPDELGPVEASLFADLDAATVDALEVRRTFPARTLGGWELKSFALANCRFREVLLLDADNVAVRDPAFLFDTDAFALERGENRVGVPDVDTEQHSDDPSPARTR